MSLRSPALVGGFFTTIDTWEAPWEEQPQLIFKGQRLKWGRGSRSPWGVSGAAETPH